MCPQDVATGQSDRDNPSTSVLSPQVILVCIKLLKKKKKSNQQFLSGTSGMSLKAEPC
jgi:hypothetical protein